MSKLLHVISLLCLIGVLFYLTFRPLSEDEDLDLGTEINSSLDASTKWAASRKQQKEESNKLANSFLAPVCAEACGEQGGKFVNYDQSQQDPTERCTCTMKDEMTFFYLYSLPGEGTRIKWILSD